MNNTHTHTHTHTHTQQYPLDVFEANIFVIHDDIISSIEDMFQKKQQQHMNNEIYEVCVHG